MYATGFERSPSQRYAGPTDRFYGQQQKEPSFGRPIEPSHLEDEISVNQPEVIGENEKILASRAVVNLTSGLIHSGMFQHHDYRNTPLKRDGRLLSIVKSIYHFVKHLIVGFILYPVGLFLSPVSGRIYVESLSHINAANSQLSFLSELIFTPRFSRLASMIDYNAIGNGNRLVYRMCKENERSFLRRHITLRIGVVFDLLIRTLFEVCYTVVGVFGLSLSIITIGRVDLFSEMGEGLLPSLFSLIRIPFKLVATLINPSLYFYSVREYDYENAVKPVKRLKF